MAGGVAGPQLRDRRNFQRHATGTCACTCACSCSSVFLVALVVRDSWRSDCSRWCRRRPRHRLRRSVTRLGQGPVGTKNLLARLTNVRRVHRRRKVAGVNALHPTWSSVPNMSGVAGGSRFFGRSCGRLVPGSTQHAFADCFHRRLWHTARKCLCFFAGCQPRCSVVATCRVLGSVTPRAVGVRAVIRARLPVRGQRLLLVRRR